MRVLLADDHPVVRAGLRHILERHETIEVIAEVEDGRAVVRQVEELSPDVVVMDISMPELNGIDATRTIHRQWPASRVLILSVHCTEDAILDAIEAGCAGYVLKEAATEELGRAVQTVAENKAYFSPAVAQVLANRITERGKRRARLSAREREVVQLICEGRPVQEIATRLFVSPQTVKTHRANAVRKLGCRGTADLIRYALKHGLAAQ